MCDSKNTQITNLQPMYELFIQLFQGCKFFYHNIFTIYSLHIIFVVFEGKKTYYICIKTQLSLKKLP